MSNHATNTTQEGEWQIEGWTEGHECCPHPFLRSEDSFGGRIAPTSGQCDCDCHETTLPRSRLEEVVKRERHYAHQYRDRLHTLTVQLRAAQKENFGLGLDNAAIVKQKAGVIRRAEAAEARVTELEAQVSRLEA